MLRKWRGRVLTIAGVLGGAFAGLWLFGERGRLMLPSTRAWLYELGGWRNFFTKAFWDGYVYARWSNQYIGWSIKYVFPRTQAAPGNNMWADGYHGKVLPTEQAQKLVTINQDIPFQDLEHIIPYPMARHIVLQGPPDIAVYECPCRLARENPCQPIDVCMIVGQPYVDFILEHNPHSSRRITQEEALQILQEEHERGHIHAAYFKEAMFSRFYAICNCCTCCCGAIDAMRRCGVPMVIASGYVAQVDEAECMACGICEDTCPFDAIQVNGTARILWDKCMGCGVCEGQCPDDAISLVLDARKGAPLRVEQLLPDQVAP